jgi:hypothetical protein
MPRDGSGIYHTPPGTDGVPDTTIESAKYNTNVHDVETDLNTPRPIVAGGTGGTSPDSALTNLKAEKYAQIVANWDSMAWMAGSFYAASTATGTAPVAGHAFAGIVYYANATDLVCEATDVTDTSNPDKYIRVMSAGVWGNWTRVVPSTSSSNLGEYTFNSQVTFPPGSGEIRFNNATQNSTTEVFISHLSPSGVDNTTALTTYLVKNNDIIVQDKDEGYKYKIFTATADAVLSGGDFRVTVTFKIAGTDVVTGQRMVVAASGEAQRVQQRQLIYAAPFDALAYNGMQVNGDGWVSQENGQTSIYGGPGGTALTRYIADGWQVCSAGAQSISFCGQAGVGPAPPPGYAGSVAVWANVANPTPAVTDYLFLRHLIEATRISRLAWGTANAQPISIGFWFFSAEVKIYSLSIRNATSDRSYVTTFTCAANTWEWKTFTIPGDTGGSWPIGTNLGLQVVITAMAGANYLTANGNTWQANGSLGVLGMGNAVSNGTALRMNVTGLIVLPGIELPSAARAPFITRPYEQELVLCKRYWRKTFYGTGIAYNAFALRLAIPHEGMRASPTLSTTAVIQVSDIYSAISTQANPDYSINTNIPDIGWYDFAAFSTLVSGRFYVLLPSGAPVLLDARF